VEIDPATGSFKRRAAHIRALEDSRRRETNGAQRALELAAAADRTRVACRELRAVLIATAARIDFATLDRAAAARGDEALAPLREQLDAVAQLALAFCKCASGGAGAAAALDARLQSLRGPPAPGGNALRAKAVLVALRALPERLGGDVDPHGAAHAAALLDQGLLEQLLSWTGEAESSYDALAFSATAARVQLAPRAPPPRATPRGFSRARSAGRAEPRPGGLAARARAAAAASFRDAAPPAPCAGLGQAGPGDDGGGAEAAAPRRCCYRERLGRCRPAPLIIPAVPERRAR
jgi:hypothetical protein